MATQWPWQPWRSGRTEPKLGIRGPKFDSRTAELVAKGGLVATAVELSVSAQAGVLPLPARNEWGEGKSGHKRPSSPQPSPPAAGEEGGSAAAFARGSLNSTAVGWWLACPANGGSVGNRTATRRLGAGVAGGRNLLGMGGLGVHARPHSTSHKFYEHTHRLSPHGNATIIEPRRPRVAP